MVMLWHGYVIMIVDGYLVMESCVHVYFFHVTMYLFCQHFCCSVDPFTVCF